MKKTMMTGLLFCFVAFNISAQTKTTKQKVTQQKATVKSKAQYRKKDSTAVMVNSHSYPAFSTNDRTRFQITDPTINTLNERAAGAPVPKNSSGIIGASKHSNGFANGHLLLRSTTATSSGTAFGSGAVGTGTSIQGVGTSETTIGVNGKSPYAGPSLWGGKQPVYTVSGSDSTRHQ